MPETKIIWTGQETAAYVDDKISKISGDTSSSIGDLEGRVSAVESKNTTQDTNISNAQKRADDAYTLAQGRSRAIAYADNASANTALAAMNNSTLRVGDNIYIGSVGVPDWYIAEVLSSKGSDTLPTSGNAFNDTYSIGYYKLYQLETEKVDLTNYATKSEAIKSITQSGGVITITFANGTTTTVDLKTAFYTESEVDSKITSAKTEAKPTQATFSGNTLTVKNASGTTLFTVSLASLSISDATFSVKGKVNLIKQSDVTAGTISSSALDSEDTKTATPKAIITRTDAKYPTQSAFNSLNTTVANHSADINDIKNNTITVRFEDGDFTTAASGGGVMILEY